MERIKNEMTKRVGCASPEDSLKDAYLTLQTLEVKHLPVVRNSKVIGILSDRDILIHSKEKHGSIEVPDKTVGDVMSKSVIVCQAENSIGHAADLMLEHKIHCLPVVDVKGDLVGIITTSDILRIVRKHSGVFSLHSPLTFDKDFQLAI